MRNYLFGYLFVKLNKLFAALVFLSCLGYSYFMFQQIQLDVESSRYRSSDLLDLQLNKLVREYSSAKSKVVDFKKLDVYQADIEFGKKSPDFLLSYTTTKQFEQLHQSLNQVNSSTSAIKLLLIHRYDELLTDIFNKLQAHSKSLASVKTNQQPPPDSPPSAAGTPRQSVHDNGLFALSLTRTDVNARISELNNAKQFLTMLASMSENPENKQKLVSSSAEVDAFIGLFPVVISDESFKPEPGQPGGNITQSPSKPLNAEKVARQLSSVQQSVAEAVLSNWAVDDAYEKAIKAYEDEAEKCRSSEYKIRKIWHDAISSIGSIIGIGCAIAFTLMVLADLTKAILDTAANTGVVSSAYKTPSESEE